MSQLGLEDISGEAQSWKMEQPGQKWRHGVDLWSGMGLWGQSLGGVRRGGDCQIHREVGLAWPKEFFDGKC